MKSTTYLALEVDINYLALMFIQPHELFSHQASPSLKTFKIHQNSIPQLFLSINWYHMIGN